MKKLLSVFIVLVMFAGLIPAAGAESLAGTYDVTVWVSGQILNLTKAQIEEFNKTNGQGITINATVEDVNEGEACGIMVADVENGGDLYCFAQDQFATLLDAGALSRIDEETAQKVKEENSADSVAAATAGEEMYAYPLTSDNGYFMYYDKRVVPEEDVDSLEKIIADCEAAEKYLAFEMNSGWYSASFFFATGCVSEWASDENGTFCALKDTYNSSEGLAAVKGMKKMVDSTFYLNSSNPDEFAYNAGVVVSGMWGYDGVSEMLGENMGVADLPSFEVDGQSYHLGSFAGSKLMGVKPQEDKKTEAALNLLAQYLTSEQAQMDRYLESSWSPTNLKDQASSEVQQNPGLVALQEQNKYATPQGQIHGSWWEITQKLGGDVTNAADEAGLQKALDDYSDAITALLVDFIGWVKNEDGTYSFRNMAGEFLKGLQNIDGVLYYFDETSVMSTGWIQDGGNWLYAADSGAIANDGWEAVDNTWYYFSPEGKMTTGWLQDGSTWYLMDDGGAMVTGWRNEGGAWYYFANSGEMTTGWLQDGGAWYLMDASGTMVTGWKNEGGIWYYFANSGTMETGWMNLDNTWYYFQPEGAMSTGWRNIGGVWYYFENSGAMSTGWEEIGGNWYWFSADGSMTTGDQVINGQLNHFDASGAWTGTD